MKYHNILIGACLCFTLTISSSYATTKRVIDQGMIDGQRKYIVACNSGKQFAFIKKYTAPEQTIDVGSELPEPGQGSSNSKLITPEFIESCVLTGDERGDICRADTEWSPRDAGIEFCQQ